MKLHNVQLAFNRSTPVLMSTEKKSNLVPILVISTLALGAYFLVVSYYNREEKN